MANGHFLAAPLSVGWGAFAFLLLIGRPAAPARAQAIHIKLVDGRNGHPMPHKCIYVQAFQRSSFPAPPSPGSSTLVATETDRNGVVKLLLVGADTEIKKRSQSPACGTAGVRNPVVKYGDTILVRPGYVACSPHRPNHSWLDPWEFDTKKALQSGIVTPNACGKARASPRPGEIILFVRPLTLWEKLKE